MNGFAYFVSVVFILCWVFNVNVADDDDEVSYLGFHNVATMPYNVSLRLVLRSPVHQSHICFPLFRCSFQTTRPPRLMLSSLTTMALAYIS